MQDTTIQVLNRGWAGEQGNRLLGGGAPGEGAQERRRRRGQGITLGKTELSRPQTRLASTLESALSAGDMPVWCCEQQRGNEGQRP